MKALPLKLALCAGASQYAIFMAIGGVEIGINVIFPPDDEVTLEKVGLEQ